MTLWRSVRATTDEQARALPGDELISQAIDTLTHGVTIRCGPDVVWPWLVQMGAGSRAGWYSYDWLDNGRQPSAERIVPELQHPALGTIFPGLPGLTEGFTLLALDYERVLTLGWLTPDGTLQVTWTFVLNEVAPGVTRLLVRVRGGPGYRFHGLPLPLTKQVIRVVHFIMQRKQLFGIRQRAESMPPETRVPPLDRRRQTRTPPGGWLSALLKQLRREFRQRPTPDRPDMTACPFGVAVLDLQPRQLRVERLGAFDERIFVPHPIQKTLMRALVAFASAAS